MKNILVFLNQNKYKNEKNISVKEMIKNLPTGPYIKEESVFNPVGSEISRKSNELRYTISDGLINISVFIKIKNNQNYIYPTVVVRKNYGATFVVSFIANRYELTAISELPSNSLKKIVEDIVVVID